MILNLNELAIDFRKASIEELSYEAVEKFLEEVQKVYSYLNIDEQLAAEELWIGFGMLGMIIDTYHYNKFYPLVNLKGYLTKSREHVKNLYGEIYAACYSHKTRLEDFSSDYFYDDDDEIFIPDRECSSDKISEEKTPNSIYVEESSTLKHAYEAISIDDIELPF